MTAFECGWCLGYFEEKDITYMANVDLYQCKGCFEKIKEKNSAERCGICLKKKNGRKDLL